MASFLHAACLAFLCVGLQRTLAIESAGFRSLQQFFQERRNETGQNPKMHTLFSVECGPYFDWQTIGLMHSYRKSRQLGPITRLLSCTEDVLRTYKNMDLAPTLVVPSWTHNPRTDDWYPAVNKPKGVLDWVQKSKAAQDVEWVVILDADMILRAPVVPWEIKAAKGRPVAAYYGYLIGCDNILAELHTKYPRFCDKVGGFLVLHIDDLRKLAPLWLSKTEEVRADTAHYATNITGDIYGHGWISEMYGYSFGAADCQLRHQIDNELMLYPGYEPMANQDPHLLHYGLSFSVGSWQFGKSSHHDDPIVNECNRLFEQPPFPQDVNEKTDGLRRAALLSIECVNTLNEGLLIHHAMHSCPEPPPSPYLTYLKENIRKAIGNDPQVGAGNRLRGTTDEPMSELAKRFLQATSSGLSETSSLMVEGSVLESPPESPLPISESRTEQGGQRESTLELATSSPLQSPPVQHFPPPWPRKDPENWKPEQVEGRPKIITLFSVECSPYFDWQTLGFMYSLKRSGHPGPVTRLLSCTEEQLKDYRGMDMAPTMVVPSWSRHPKTGEWYPAINKPVGVNHWLQNSPDANEVEWVIILDADMILRRPMLPWDLGAEKGHPVSAAYGYLIGCDNILGQLHMKDPSVCDKVGGFIIMHIDDLRKQAPLWISKTEEVRADTDHYATNITGDVYGKGWISEMYGYSFAASDVGLRHKIDDTVMLYPGYMPVYRKDPRVLHYGLPMNVLDWSWEKGIWHTTDVANQCGMHFPDPPDPSLLPAGQDEHARRRDLIVIECVAVLNRAIREYHRKVGCPEEGERDVGNMDLGLASPETPYEEPERKVLVKEGEVVEGFRTAEHIGVEGEEKGIFVTLEKERQPEVEGKNELEGKQVEEENAEISSSVTTDEAGNGGGTGDGIVSEKSQDTERRELKVDGIQDPVRKGESFKEEKKPDIEEHASKTFSLTGKSHEGFTADHPRWWIAVPWVFLLLAIFLFLSRRKWKFFGRGSERSRRRTAGAGKAAKASRPSKATTSPLPARGSSQKDTTL